MTKIKTLKEFYNLAVNIKMLNVGDGDAILITLQKENRNLLVVVDGGDSSTSRHVLNEITLKCTELEKEGPDLIICTHCDSDHIAGIISIVEHFRRKIGEIWLHKPPTVIEESYEAIHDYLDWFNGTKSFLTESAKLIRFVPLTFGNREIFNFLLESVKQQKTLIDLIERYQIKNKEPYTKECELKDWPEIEIIGPTRIFYNSLFKDKSIKKFLVQEHEINLTESTNNQIPAIVNPCSNLHLSPKTSATNEGSVIFKVNTIKHSLLFTGDAGLKSFEAIPDYRSKIKDMTFLKIPHHGSINNITADLINLINPNYAFNSGYDYENPNVIGCLKSKNDRVIRSTKDGDLELMLTD